MQALRSPVAITPAPQEALSCASCAVRPTALFGVLPAAALDGAQHGVKHVDLRAGQRLYAQGDSGWSVFTVREGIVRFERFTENGTRRIVRLAGPGSLIGQEAILQRPYVDDVVACTPAKLCRIPRTDIEALAEQQPTMVRELMNRWQFALEAAAQWTTDVQSGSATRRVLKLLLHLAALTPGGHAIWLPQREEIGVMLGMAPETASRIISQLRRKGVVVACGIEQARVDLGLLHAALQAHDLHA